MKKLRVSLLLLLSGIFMQHSIAQANWRIISSSNASITSNMPYYLQAVKDKSHLTYKRRPYGINLSWGRKPAPDFQFVKEGGGEIKCGDKVALYNNTGGYIRYKRRPQGINLVWSSTPVFEWEIRTVDNVKGASISPNTPVGLYNSVENDFMRKCTKPGVPVVDLAWVIDCPNGYRLPGALANTTYNNMTRDQVVAYAIILGLEIL